jgi:hypothetical protein
MSRPAGRRGAQGARPQARNTSRPDWHSSSAILFPAELWPVRALVRAGADDHRVGGELAAGSAEQEAAGRAGLQARNRDAALARAADASAYLSLGRCRLVTC